VRRRAIVLIAVALLAALAGCSNGASDDTQTDGPTSAGPGNPDKIGEAVAGPSGVPIPKVATRSKLFPPSDDPQASSGYDLPTGITLNDLDAWYEREMPEGKDWQGWTWCERVDTTDEQDGTIQRDWGHPGTENALIVSIGDNNDGHMYILIANQTNGGACET
jgi:hypothetical protein